VSEKAIVEALLSHVPLSVAFLLIIWKATPYLIKSTLRNGGGEIIRAHVDAANAAQSVVTHAAIGNAIRDHEEREFRQYGDTREGLVVVREHVASLAAKLEVHLATRAT
jgi:hypothetical protein